LSFDEGEKRHRLPSSLFFRRVALGAEYHQISLVMGVCWVFEASDGDDVMNVPAIFPATGTFALRLLQGFSPRRFPADPISLVPVASPPAGMSGPADICGLPRAHAQHAAKRLDSLCVTDALLKQPATPFALPDTPPPSCRARLAEAPLARAVNGAVFPYPPFRFENVAAVFAGSRFREFTPPVAQIASVGAKDIGAFAVPLRVKGRVALFAIADNACVLHAIIVRATWTMSTLGYDIDPTYAELSRRRVHGEPLKPGETPYGLFRETEEA
jgi:hypothetical protein